MNRLILGFICLLFNTSLHASEQILSFHSQIEIQQNGDLHVTESIHVRAENHQINRGIYRDFPTLYKDKLGTVTRVGFDVLSVKRDGQAEPYHLKALSNGQRVYIGDSKVILAPGEYRYDIEYNTNRQLGFFENYDELYWNVTGNDWSFPIIKASADVHLPAKAEAGNITLTGYTGLQGSTHKNLTHRITESGRFHFETTQLLEKGEGLTIVANWPKGIIQPPSAEQQRAFLIQDNKHQLIALGGLIVVLAYYLLLWFKVGRDPVTGIIMPLYKPPEGFSPASMRYIQQMKYDTNCFTAALVNLTIKGAITIDKTESSLLSKGNFVVKNQNDDRVKLAAGEEQIMQSLFNNGDEITLSRKEHVRVRDALNKHRGSLHEDYEKLYFATNKKYFIPGILISLAAIVYAVTQIPDADSSFSTVFFSFMSVIPFVIIASIMKKILRKRKSKLSIVSIAIQVAFFGFFFFSLADVAAQMFQQLEDVAWPIVISAYLMIATNLLFEQWLKAPTLAGRKLLDKIESFKLYLDVAEKDEIRLSGTPRFSIDIFEQYLPYAIALGVDHAWSQKLEQAIQSGQVASSYKPRGFIYYNTRHGLSDFSSSLANNLGAAVSSSSTAPGSSSGSSGGSSGGGGGGGGGGGW